jgi:hypothetical protein
MAAPDQFGHVRILIVDASWAAVARATGASLRIHAPDADGVRGEYRLTAPAARRGFWLERAAELRGRRVCADAAYHSHNNTFTLSYLKEQPK